MNIRAKANPATTMSPAEWESRVDLAAVYRLVAHYGWDDVIYNHVGDVADPNKDEHFPVRTCRRNPRHY